MSTVSYYTAEGLKKLRDELDQLKSIERPKASQDIAEARDKGDLSENAEYDAAKEAQGLLEMRISKMEEVVSNARLIDESQLDLSKALVLSNVKIKNQANGMEMTYTLVAESEADLKTGKISVTSPIGKGLLGKSEGEVAEITVPNGTLKFEAGVHRVQRVPQTETQGRVHTSAATVMVLPEAEEFDVQIDMNDVRVDFFCSSGPGGQSVNTTKSAVRLTHIPTGLVAQCQDQKSQHKNKDKAMEVLRSRLYEKELAIKQAEDATKRSSQVSSGDRSAKIRTYNYSQGRVTDHRIGLDVFDMDGVMNGKIQKFVDELQLVNNMEKLKENEVF